MTHFKTEKLLNKMNKNISNKIFGKLASKVKRKVFLCFFFFIIVFDCAVFEASAQNFGRNGFGQRNLAGGRESRKLFGGYRITPQYCKPIRAGRRNRGETICMFNHECTRRDGEVVGACMDGFLFGACCQLKETKELHIPKGPGVVMHHYLNSEDEISESDALGSYNDFGNTPPTQETYHFSTINNIVTPTKLYTEIRTTDQDISSPSSNDLSTASPGGYVGFSTEKMTSQSDVFSDGLSQITSSLLNEPPKNVELNNGDHLFNKGSSNEAETILLHQNGSAVEDVLRPSDFTLDSGIEVSNMQTKPTSVATPSSSSSTIPSTMYTHKPIYQKPGFKPKPFKKPTTTTTEKYILVQTVTKPEKIPPSMTSSADFVPEQASIDSILQMLNDTTPTKIDEEAATQSIVSELSSNSEVKEVTRIPATVPPVSYTSGYPPSYISSSRYPSTSTRYPSTSTRYPSTSNKYTSTSTRYPTTSNKYQSTSTRYPSTSTRYPSTSTRYPSTSTRYPSTSTRYPSTSTKYPSTGHFITTVKTPSTSYVYGSTLPQKPQVTEDGTRLPITNTASYDNYYQTSPFDTTSDEDKLTTVSYVSSSTTRRPTTTTRKPPSTSYIYSGIATKRPISSVQNYGPTYDIAPKPDSFSSVTPTVIVLGGLNQQTPESAIVEYQTAASEDSPDNFVEIPQEPFKKPVSQVTINNVISSTHNIHLGQKKPVPSNAKPTPTVLITPKPTSTSAYEAWPEATTTHDPNRYTISSSIGTTPSSLSSTYSVQSANPEPQFPESLYVPNHKFSTTIVPEMQTSPDDLINFPPVRNPNLNATGSNPNTVFNSSISMGIDDLSILQEVEFTTPSFLQEDEVLNDKMSIFVSKIVGSLQGTFQELHDIVILDKKPNTTITRPASTAKPTKKPAATTKKPPVTTKKPTRVGTTATKKPTKKPVRVTTATKKPTTTPAPTTVVTTTKKPVRATSTTKKPKPTKKVTTTSPTPTSTEIFDEVTTDSLDTTTIDYEDKELCGVRPMVRSGRIVGGKNAAFGEWPWQVMVRESTWLGLFTKNKCGGVLITNRYVTTAAHCQPGFLASLVAVFGEHDISGDLEKKRPITKNVRRVIVHRLYDAATFENDLALLELDTPVKFDSHIVPICMPPDEADYTGRMASVTGWGRLKYGGGVPAILQEVQVPVIENSVCQEMFQTAGHSKIILNSFLCAGYANGQKDSCEGDSGGPLVLQRADGRWQLIGTVSHGIKCAAPYLPGVYMRTTFYKPWLKSITGVN